MAMPAHAVPVEAPAFVAATEPAGFEPWIDWTLDAETIGSGAILHEPLREPGTRTLGARWAFGSSAAQDDEHPLTLYRASFVELGSTITEIQDGQAYTLRVRTDPPGFENYVRWSAATLFGQATPSSGRGRAFTTTFSGTLRGRGSEPAGRWLGIQAGNAYFNLDQSGTLFGGLTQTALGSAHIAVTEAGLEVTNIGSSGQDGVSVAAGKSDGIHLVRTLPPSDSMPVGAYLINRLRVGGKVGGQMRIDRVAGGFQFTPDFSTVGASTYTLEFKLQGATVYQHSGVSGPIGVTASLSAQDGICSHYKDPPGYNVTSQEGAALNWTLNDGTPLTADFVVAEPESPQVPVDSSGIVSMDFLASGVSHFTVQQEFLMLFGTPTRMSQPHAALGAATFTATAGQLQLSNLSGGDDGVRADFDELGPVLGMPPTQEFAMALSPLALGSGETLTLTAHGTANGVAGAALGTLTARGKADSLALSADFSALGSGTAEVEAFSAGQFVGSVEVAAGGTIGSLTGGPQVDTAEVLTGSAMPGYVLGTQGATTFVPSSGGQSPLTGDEFRVLAAGATAHIDHLSSFDVVASLTAGRLLVVTGESVPQGTSAVPRPSGGAVLTELQVYPNPTHRAVAVRFGLGHGDAVVVELLDAAGRIVRHLRTGTLASGVHVVGWDGASNRGLAAPSGLYVLRVTCGREVRTARVVLMR
jgi:hypothetical protein